MSKHEARKANLKFNAEMDEHMFKAAIQEGIDSGIAHNFDPKKHLKFLKSKTRKSE